MTIKSPAFENNSPIPSTYSGNEDNISPPLEISDVPSDAQSLALIMDDPDAPGGTFTHWIMWNIDPLVKEIAEEDWPEGADQGMNGTGELGYTGPQPPSGTHRYFFKLYALSKKLDLPGNVSKEKLEKEIEGVLIEKAELVGKYSSDNY